MADSYKDLLVWQKAMNLAVSVYRTTAMFPKEEIYGLTSQVRRAAVSIASNIAEGKGCYSNADFQHFLIQARGSVNEVETQVMLAGKLEFLDESTVRVLLGECEEVGRMLNGLIGSLRKAASSSAG